MSSYNSKAFTPEEVEKGLHLDLINYLLEYNKKSSECYEDIHITNDTYCTIVEWCDVSCDNEFSSGKFEFVDENQAVINCIKFPDNHVEYLEDNEAESRANEWLEENKEEFGNWEFNNNYKNFIIKYKDSKYSKL